MRAVFEEYGQFIIALIVFVTIMLLFNGMVPAYKKYSRAFIAGLTGVPYSQTEYNRW